MVEQQITLTRGGIYLAKLNPAKSGEVGKIRPVVVLNSQEILNANPPVIFICPLRSQSQPEFNALHFELSVRDNLKVKSYALVEHCRSITIGRIINPRVAQVTLPELNNILHKLQVLIGI